MKDYIPIAADAVDLSSEDHTFAHPRIPQALRSNVSGTFYATLVGNGITEEASQAYTVSAGQYVHGYFASVERATSDTAFQNDTALVALIFDRTQLV